MLETPRIKLGQSAGNQIHRYLGLQRLYVIYLLSKVDQYIIYIREDKDIVRTIKEI